MAYYFMLLSRTTHRTFDIVENVSTAPRELAISSIWSLVYRTGPFESEMLQNKIKNRYYRFGFESDHFSEHVIMFHNEIGLPMDT